MPKDEKFEPATSAEQIFANFGLSDDHVLRDESRAIDLPAQEMTSNFKARIASLGRGASVSNVTRRVRRVIPEALM